MIGNKLWNIIVLSQRNPDRKQTLEYYDPFLFEREKIVIFQSLFS
jgi:hypothetical protein